MSRYGYAGGCFVAWNIIFSGFVSSGGNVGSTFASRPVFYLNTNVTLKVGEGTIDNPFIIKIDGKHG